MACLAFADAWQALTAFFAHPLVRLVSMLGWFLLGRLYERRVIQRRMFHQYMRESVAKGSGS
jgi:hypothetical protein